MKNMPADRHVVHRPPDAVIPWSLDVDRQDIVPVTEDVIGAFAHNAAGLCLVEVFDDLLLVFKQLLVPGKWLLPGNILLPMT